MLPVAPISGLSGKSVALKRPVPVKVKLTKSNVEQLEPPAAGERVVWDKSLTGFGVRILPTGRRTYFIYGRTRGKRQVKFKIGVHGTITATKAREIAEHELGKVASGSDPVEEKKQLRAAETKRLGTPTVSQLCDKYLAEYALVYKRPSSVEDDRSMIELIIKPRLGSKRVPDVEQDHIATLHRELKATPYRANRVLALLSKMFGLSIRTWKLCHENPVIGVKRYDEEKKQRYLNTKEIWRLTNALSQHPNNTTANVIRMLLLTGARRGEVLNMTWNQVDQDPGVWVKPSSHTKNKEEHRLTLSSGASLLIEEMRKTRKEGEQYVFPGRSRGQPLGEIKTFWGSIKKKADLEGVRIHDLRHTHASLLAGRGSSLPIIGALLGHTQASTTKRYVHLDEDPLREATRQVSDLLDAIAKQKEGDVIPLRRR
jgi:integrase